MAAHAAVRRFKADALERIGWTAVEAAAAVAITEVTPLDTWWALLLAPALAGLKSLAAKNLGMPNTASTLPAGKDPAAAAGGIVPPTGL